MRTPIRSRQRPAHSSKGRRLREERAHIRIATLFVGHFAQRPEREGEVGTVFRHARQQIASQSFVLIAREGQPELAAEPCEVGLLIQLGETA